MVALERTLEANFRANMATAAKTRAMVRRLPRGGGIIVASSRIRKAFIDSMVAERGSDLVSVTRVIVAKDVALADLLLTGQRVPTLMDPDYDAPPDVLKHVQKLVRGVNTAAGFR